MTPYPQLLLGSKGWPMGRASRGQVLQQHEIHEALHPSINHPVLLCSNVFSDNIFNVLDGFAQNLQFDRLYQHFEKGQWEQASCRLDVWRRSPATTVATPPFTLNHYSTRAKENFPRSFWRSIRTSVLRGLRLTSFPIFPNGTWSQRFDKAVRLCRYVKTPELWASLAVTRRGPFSTGSCLVATVALS